MSGPFNRSGVNTGGTGQVFSDDTYSDINTGGSGQLFPSEQYSTEERVAGEIYTLQINEGILELVDSQGNIAGTYTLPTVTDDRTGAIATGPFAFDGVVIGDNGGLEFSIHNSHGQHGNFAAHLQERIGTGVVVTTVLDDENNVISTSPGEEPITAAAVAAMGRELVSDNRVADSYPAENDEFLLTAGGIVEAIEALSGEGAHITTSGTGSNVVGVDVSGEGNVTNLRLGNIEGGEGFNTIFGDPNSDTSLTPANGDVIFERSVGQWWTYVTASNPAETRWVRFTGQHLSDIVDVDPTNLGVDTGVTVSSTEATANGNETIITASGNFTNPRPAVGQHVLFVDSNEGRELFLIQSVTTNSINILGNYEGKIPVGNAIHVTTATNRYLTWNPTAQEYQFAEVESTGGTPTFVNTAAWEAQEHISTDIEYYISTNDNYDPTTSNTDLAAQGYSDGDEFFIVSRDTTYQVISTGGNLALQFILTNRDTLATLDGGQSVLDDILDNAAAIEANTQHNHEQDARIAALENQDFTTTISSFTESTTLSNLFTSGTIINKGNAGNNLYQAWTVTREGHELIGYLQLTDTERDSFRNEFSLTQGSSSNIYIPANPDSPHTIGIKAFPAADFNDLSTNTQVMLGQISSMRFGGNVGSETMFEIRWELLNYSDEIDTGLGTVDSGEIYGAAGDKRYAFLASTIYTAPAWEFREATVSRTEVITTGTDNALRTAPATVANDDAWLAYINGLGYLWWKHYQSRQCRSRRS